MKYYLHAVLAAVLATLSGQAVAQGTGGPLTTHGLHQHTYHSAAVRAFGGVSLGAEGNSGAMFMNPATLQALDGIQVSVGGVRQSRDLEQEQNFAPVRYYPNLSLLLEGRTEGIPDPDPDLVGFTPADTVQRPLDDIQPFWSRSLSTMAPMHAVLAAPLSLSGLTLTAGVGAVQYANLDHYYQNNNVLDPDVLSARPLPTLRPTDDNPLSVDWYQTIRSREGTMRGYGAAFAAHIQRYNLTIGLSGLLLDGDTDDLEQEVQRGRLTFLANEFRADSSFGTVTRRGTSDFSGQEFTFSSTLHGEYVSIGMVVIPPTTYTRAFNMDVTTDTAGIRTESSVSGEDELQLPWRGSLGLVLTPRDRLKMGLQYEIRPYSSATFTSADGAEAEPWRSASLLRVGVEYDLASWLIIRGGIRGEADVFIPEGSALVDEPAAYRVYSAGFGLSFAGLRWNVAYENAQMKYQDVWSSALSKNVDARHVITADISFTIPTR